MRDSPFLYCFETSHFSPAKLPCKAPLFVHVLHFPPVLRARNVTYKKFINTLIADRSIAHALKFELELRLGAMNSVKEY